MTGALRHGSFYELANAVADHQAYFLSSARWISAGMKGIVGARGEVIKCVE